MTALRIAFAGTPHFALPALRALLASRHQVVGVLTQPDRPAGRGRELRASPVKLLALAHRPARGSARNPEERRRARGARRVGADLLVVVAYGLILPRAVLQLPRLGCLNIHGSLLPRWRGAAPIQRATLAGDAETGITIMQLDAGLDTGPCCSSAAGPSACTTRPATCTTRSPSSARRRCWKPSMASPRARCCRARSPPKA